MTTFEVTNAATLATALGDAVGGDRIECASGGYGDVNIAETYASDVTIVSADPDNQAVFTGLGLVGDHIIFDRINFTYENTGEITDTFTSVNTEFEIDNSTFITVRNCIFTGDLARGNAGFGSGGVAIRNTDNLVIEFNIFHHWFKGLGIHACTTISLAHNLFEENNNDDLNFTQVVGLTIEENWFHQKLTNESGHNDHLQMWSGPGFARTTDLIIRKNFIDGGTGKLGQLLFMMNEAADPDRFNLPFVDYAYHDILIEDNIFYGSHVNGIAVGETDGLIVRNNTLIFDQFQISSWLPPEIRSTPSGALASKSINVTVADNIAIAGPDVAFAIQHSDSEGTNYYGDVFVNALISNPTLADLRAVPGGAIITNGYGAARTRSDIPLVVGPTDMEPLIDDLVVELWDGVLHELVSLLNEFAILDAVFLATGDAAISVTVVVGGNLDGLVGSIRLNVDDDLFWKVENNPPYSLFGDDVDGPLPGLDLPTGAHNLQLEVYAGADATGTLLADFTVNFTVGGARIMGSSAGIGGLAGEGGIAGQGGGLAG